ncbi:acyl-CoA dehydrogenase family protein [Nocardia takedensis]|uniref:acyl-CoA dehydrogenase family protein n=1 Tax=Nocardia takedensis TaxID=259390 RepID=UPI0005945980|nr:acyl-CoA dehydrogenase family protein [Nocardia takedensis]
MATVFDHLLTAPLRDAPEQDLAGAWARHREVARGFESSLDAAIAGGFAADRLGFAFLSGYQEALRALIPAVGVDEIVALSATEEGGAHPAAIETRLVDTPDGARVTGTKTFTTLGTLASRVVVIAAVGPDDQGRNVLRAALVEVDQPGVAVSPLEPVPFAPEIPHARVVLSDARAEPLPGDGYSDYLKPFRTLEDAHVFAATLGWLVRIGRLARWPQPVLQRLLAALAGLRGADPARPKAPGVHIALGGLFDQVDQLLAEIEPLWSAVDSTDRERWERDRRLLGTAGRVRALRLSAAWRVVESSGGH